MSDTRRHGNSKLFVKDGKIVNERGELAGATPQPSQPVSEMREQLTSVVVLSRFPEIFAGFKESVDRDAPELVKSVTWDSHGELIGPDLEEPWYENWPHEDFNIARFANAGWHTADPRSDVLYSGDDVRILEPNTIARLEALAASDKKIGILAARIRPQYSKGKGFSPEPFVAFVFVFIKRDVIDKIGYLDERFKGYGVEDIDYCVRARQAGFEVGFADGVTIQHGVDGHPHMSTFLRVKTHEQIAKEDAANWARFAEKYGLPNDRKRIWEFVRNLK